MKVSNIIAGVMRWGVWGAQFDTKQYLKAIETCIDMGITSFDHADIYGDYTTEAEFGNALKYLNVRKDIQLITKCGIKMVSARRSSHSIKSYDCSTAHIITSVENSLRNLETDYIDVLLLHRPNVLMNPEEVSKAVDILKSDGKILSFGVSNFSVSQMELLQTAVNIEFNQIELSPLVIEPFTNGVVDYCYKQNINVMAWSPVKGGAIYENEKLNTTISSLANKYLCHKDTIAIAWLLKHPAKIKAVTGSSKMDRLQFAQNATSIDLTTEDWYLIYSAALGKEVD